MKAFWKLNSLQILKANRWQIFESFLKANRWMKMTSFFFHLLLWQKKCYFADPLLAYLLITVRTNERVNARDSKMLQTNCAMRSDYRRRSHTQFVGWKKIINVGLFESPIVNLKNTIAAKHLVLSHFGTCMSSNVETSLSWTCLVSGPLNFEYPSVLLFCFQSFH